jgi:hypothetical protein
MTIRHRIPFEGSRAASGPLTWGQLEMWDEAQTSQEGVPTFANMLGGGPLPPGSKVERVLEALGRLLERHESLRTRYRTGPGGSPLQEVVSAGEAEVEVVALAPDTAVPAIVEDWWPAMDAPYDLAGGLPFRARIGTVAGEPTFVMFGMSHLSSDFLGTRVLYDELLGLLDGREPQDPPPLSPIGLAELEGSAPGRRVMERALDHWRRELSAAPPAMFAGPAGTPSEPRYWRGGIRSRTAASALERAAERTGVGASYILLAAMAALVGRHTGLDRCSVRIVAGNRGRPELRRAVGNLSQEAPLVIDLRADTFQAVLETARAASLRAQRHGRYDPRRAAELIAEHDVDLDVCFNDLWTPTRRATGTPPHADTAFAWEEKVDRASVAFFLEAFEVLDDPDAIRLSLFADTAHVPPTTLRAFLDALERLLVTLAERDVRLEEIAPVPRPH